MHYYHKISKWNMTVVAHVIIVTAACDSLNLTAYFSIPHETRTHSTVSARIYI